MKGSVHVPRRQVRLASVHRVGHRHHDRAPHQLGMRGEDVVGDARAEVLPDEMDGRPTAQPRDEVARVGGERAAVEEPVARNLRRRIAAQPGGYRAKARLGERPHLVAPRPRGVRKAVEEQDSRPLALLEIGELDPVGGDPSLAHGRVVLLVTLARA